ncbi:MAG: hypothetical protein ACOZCO_11350 [Bacteroidota bacterium]
MKYFSFIFLLLVFLSCSKKADIEKYQSYPRYEEVVNQFFKEYYFPESKDEFYRFAKTKPGYEIISYKYEDYTEKETGRNLFWSLEEKRYMEPGEKFRTNRTFEHAEYQKKYHIRQSYNYNRMIYYGYKGCEDDIIEELEDASNLTDTLMESLARAYGGKANTIVSDIYNEKKKREPTTEEMDLFSDFIRKETALYEKIKETNPGYQTLIGRVDVKCAHQGMYGFYQMDMWEENERAKEFLDKTSYGPFMENYAANLLNSCEKNGIIITAGDGDTFPLWYMQEKKGIRKDVAVINSSLLNVPEYISYVRRKYKLKMKLTDEEYERHNLDVVSVSETAASTSEISQVLEYISRESKKTDEEKWFTIDANRFTLTLTDSVPSADSSLIPAGKIVFKRNYLYKSHIAQLDIISSNYPDRKTHFSGEYNHDWDRELNMHMEAHGIVVVLSHYIEKISSYGAHINREDQKKYLLEIYKYGISGKNGFESEPMVSNYLYAFANLANSFSDAGLPREAKIILDRSTKEIPVKKLEGYSGEVMLSMAYMKIPGEENKATEFCHAALDKVEKELDKPDADKERMLGYVNMIITQFMIRNPDKKLMDRCMAMKEKLEKSIVKY